MRRTEGCRNPVSSPPLRMLERLGPMPKFEIGASQYLRGRAYVNLGGPRRWLTYLQQRELNVVDKRWASDSFDLRR